MTYPLIPFLTLAFSSTITPGPNNIMCMTLGHQIGFKNTLKYIYGAFVGNLILQIIIAIFSTILYRIIPILSYIISIIGVFYLIYLALSILRSSYNIKDNKKIIPMDKLFITALSLQFINPKAIIFSLTIITTFITPYFHSSINIFAMIFLLTSIVALSQSLWAGSGALLSNFINKYELYFNIIMSLALFYCAFSILMTIPFLKHLFS